MTNELPDSVRYVKNGGGGRWWKAARDNGQLHAGWSFIDPELLLNPDWSAIERKEFAEYGDPGVARRDLNALRDLLDSPKRHVWVTFEDGCMWWCTVRDGAKVNPLTGDSGDGDKGHFWLLCEKPWSNLSIKGKRLEGRNLPGNVTRVAGFRGTVCEPRFSAEILRAIRNETNPVVEQAIAARRTYEEAIGAAVKILAWQDFELLIDLILQRSGWSRESVIGKTLKAIDIDARNVALGERAFIQVKSEANQAVLDSYVKKFNEQHESYDRMIFAVHSPDGKLTAPTDRPVQVWDEQKLAELIVGLGLGGWVEAKLG